MRSLRIFIMMMVACALPLAACRHPAPSQSSLSQSSLSHTSHLRWYKGNTHTHTSNSDGDSTPDEVVRWYREHGYHFVVLTDHNVVGSVDALNALYGDEGFLVIKGEEVSNVHRTSKSNLPIHVNGLNVERVVSTQNGNSVVEVLQRSVDAVRAASGVPQINHPNLQGMITADELKQVQNYKLFEVFNGHPRAKSKNAYGGSGLEETWDLVLSSGRLLYGVAADDAHDFKRLSDPTTVRPGTGWVVVRAEWLSVPAILNALEQGEFYASTGVELTDYQVDDKSMTVAVKKASKSTYRVLFIGAGGRLLKEVVTNPVVYRFMGDEQYVRATVLESSGKAAWTQPVMLRQP